MVERVVQANGIEIAYETYGDPRDPPLVMIIGLGLQLVHWDPDLCRQLAGEGFYVVVFDNRDSGHSSKIEGAGTPSIWAALVGWNRTGSYRLGDMADDTVGLLDELEIGRAHLLGVSLGGMIAQTVSSRHPSRVSSLASLMSTTGSRRVGLPRFRALRVLLRRPPAGRDQYIDHFVRAFRAIGSPAFPATDARMRDLAATGYDRGYHPRGVMRQLLAVTFSGNRTATLRNLDVPTVVIHGREDPMLRISAGRATAAAIPGAELVEIAGMGHDLPSEVWPTVINAVVRNAARAGEAARVPAAA